MKARAGGPREARLAGKVPFPWESKSSLVHAHAGRGRQQSDVPVALCTCVGKTGREERREKVLIRVDLDLCPQELLPSPTHTPAAFLQLQCDNLDVPNKMYQPHSHFASSL